MRRIPGLVATLLRDWWRNREAVFFSFLFPVILLVIFSTVFGGGGAAEFTVFVQNNDVDAAGEATNLSSELVDALDDVDPITVRSIDPGRNVTEWSRETRTTGSKRVVVIPEGFADRVRNRSVGVRLNVIVDTVQRFQGRANGTGTPNGTGAPNGSGAPNGTSAPNGTAGGNVTQLTRMANATNATPPAEVTFLAAPDDESAPAVRGIVASVVAEFNRQAIGVERPTVTVASGDLGTRNLGGVDYYLPALIATIVVINGVITVTSIVAQYGADGTLKRLAATPLRKSEWIVANVVQQSLLALVLTAGMLVVAALVFGVTAIPGPLAVALLLVGAVGFSALGIALGGLIDDPDAATSLGNAVALPLMFLSGTFWQIEIMPGYLQTAATLSPLYHFHRGLRRLMILDTTEGIVLPFAILTAMAVVFVALAVRVTRWQDFGG